MTGCTGGRIPRSGLGLVAVCAALALSAQGATASLLLQEAFSYPDGNLVGNGTWTAHSGAGAIPVQVTAGQAVVQQGSGTREDVNVSLGGFILGAGGVVYAAFDVNVTGGNSAVYFAHFKDDSTSNFNSRVFVVPPTGAGDYTIGLSGSSGTVQATWASDLTFGVTYRVVTSYNFDSGLSQLWVNPVDINSTSISNTGATSNDISTYALRQATPASGSSTQTVDNLCVATSFGEALNCEDGGGPVTGACCEGLDCTVQTQADCQTAGGNYLGDNVPCSPGACNPTTGACCIGGVCTPNLSEADCENGGGIWRGPGTGCPIACNFAGIGINEVRADQLGVDNDEYAEIIGPPGFNLAGLTYVVIGDGTAAAASGVIETVIELTGVIPADGHYLIANPETFTLAPLSEINLAIGANTFENEDNVTHLLVGGFTGAVAADLDTNDDCALDATPWSLLLDSVAIIETFNPPVNAGDECSYSATTAGPNGTLAPGHVWRNPNGPPNAFAIGPFDPVIGDDTPGKPNAAGSGACCDGLNCTVQLRTDCEAAQGIYRGTGVPCSPNPCNLTCFTIADAKAAAVDTEMRVCNVVVTNVIDTISSANDASLQVQDPVSGLGLTIFGANAIIEQMIVDAGGTLVNPALALGRKIDIEGVVGEFQGLRQHIDGTLALRVVQLFPDAPVVPPPTVTSLTSLQDGSPVAELLESVRVRLNCVAFLEQGTFAGGTNYTITDGNTLATVRVPTSLVNVVGTAIPTGMVDLVGILSQFDATDPRTEGYQLLLLETGDILPPTCGATPIGACCRADTTCGEVTQAVCQDRNGTYQGNTTLCVNVTCPLIETGACCLDNDECVVGVLPVQCCDLDGVFLGPNTTCAVGNCDAPQDLAAIHVLPTGVLIRTREVIVTDTTDLIASTASKSFIVQDFSGAGGETRGYAIFGSNANIDALLAQVQVGSRIVLAGTTGAFNGLQQLVAPFTLVQNCGLATPPPIVPITVADMQDGSPRGEELESVLVTLSCVTFNAAGGTFAGGTNYTVTEDGGTLTTIVRVQTAQLDLVGQTIPSGPVAVTGVLSQFDGTVPQNGGYQLLPRSMADIVSCDEPGACCVEGGGGGACPTCVGDMDGNGVINLNDVTDFVNALIGDPLNNPGALACANVDGVGSANGLDIDDFVDLVLSNSACGAGCTVVTVSECTALNGTFRGAGVPCTPDPCGEVGSCCLPDETACLENVSLAQCQAANANAVWTLNGSCNVTCPGAACGAAANARKITPCTVPNCDASNVSPPDGWCTFRVIGAVADPDCPSCFIFPNTFIDVPCNGGPCPPELSQQVFRRVIDGQEDCFFIAESIGFPPDGACASPGSPLGSLQFDDVP